MSRALIVTKEAEADILDGYLSYEEKQRALVSRTSVRKTRCDHPGFWESGTAQPRHTPRFSGQVAVQPEVA